MNPQSLRIRALISVSVSFLGVGQFTIVDGEKVTGEDVGNNFFLERGIKTVFQESIL